MILERVEPEAEIRDSGSGRGELDRGSPHALEMTNDLVAREYCKQDTWAMVELLRVVRAVSRHTL